MGDPRRGCGQAVLASRFLPRNMRMTSQMKNARYVADFLNDHPKVANVHYLGLLTEDDREFELYKRQCLSPGSIIAFEVVGGEAEAFRFLNALEIVIISNNLGDAKSIATHPATTTHQRLSAEDRDSLGLDDGMVRLSVGLEDPADVQDDLEQAFAAA